MLFENRVSYIKRTKHKLEDDTPPFPGKVYHCALVCGLVHATANCLLTMDMMLIIMLFTGGMNTACFNGVRRGQYFRSDCDQVVKKCIETKFHGVLL